MVAQTSRSCPLCPQMALKRAVAAACQPLRLGPVSVRLPCKPLTPITLTVTHIHDYAE